LKYLRIAYDILDNESAKEALRFGYYEISKYAKIILKYSKSFYINHVNAIFFKFWSLTIKYQILFIKQN